MAIPVELILSFSPSIFGDLSHVSNYRLNIYLTSLKFLEILKSPLRYEKPKYTSVIMFSLKMSFGCDILLIVYVIENEAVEGRKEGTGEGSCILQQIHVTLWKEKFFPALINCDCWSGLYYFGELLTDNIRGTRFVFDKCRPCEITLNFFFLPPIPYW